jgi:hypothetical protein
MIFNLEVLSALLSDSLRILQVGLYRIVHHAVNHEFRDKPNDKQYHCGSEIDDEPSKNSNRPQPFYNGLDSLLAFRKGNILLIHRVVS